eukprot:TRINITY_DN103839_c0_g1_i1.p1 TRINITY_DN103839_c0_g1~~TRINITY_DN103839_c0_g1_i1.p1  ORF type:complete len:424 (-),score=102.95 TRINITY_DN103839_c0_g1_i1:150-1421(-)
MEDNSESAKTGGLKLSDVFDRIDRDIMDAEQIAGLKLVVKCLDNVLNHPNNPKYKRISLDNPKFRNTIWCFIPLRQLILGAGFCVETASVFLDASKEIPEKILFVRNAVASFMNKKHPQIQLPQAPEITKTTTENNFNVFEAKKYSLSDAPQMKAPTKTASELQRDKLKKKEAALTSEITSVERRIKYYAPGEKVPPPNVTHAGLSDSQLQRQYLKGTLSANRKEEQFSTRAMREVQELKQKIIYKRACVRCRMPDSSILEAYFHPKERVGAIYDLLRSHINKSLSAFGFVLRVSPPPTDLNPAHTLEACHLVPASKIHFIWTAKVPQIKGPMLVFTQEELSQYKSQTNGDTDMEGIITSPPVVEKPGDVFDEATHLVTTPPTQAHKGGVLHKSKKESLMKKRMAKFAHLFGKSTSKKQKKDL